MDTVSLKCNPNKVAAEPTVFGFNMIMDGELDHLPEAAFNLKGTIEEAIEAGQKMLAEA